MADIPLITELLIKQEKGRNLWKCFYNVDGFEQDFLLNIGLFNARYEPYWMCNGSTHYHSSNGFLMHFSDKDEDWDNHILYQCVLEIKKLPHHCLRMMFSDIPIRYRGEFTPSEYRKIQTEFQWMEKKPILF